MASKKAGLFDYLFKNPVDIKKDIQALQAEGVRSGYYWFTDASPAHVSFLKVQDEEIKPLEVPDIGPSDMPSLIDTIETLAQFRYLDGSRDRGYAGPFASSDVAAKSIQKSLARKQRSMLASSRGSLIRLASTLPVGSASRRALLRLAAKAGR